MSFDIWRFVQNMRKTKKEWTISINSPVILCYVVLCATVLILARITGGATTEKFFSVYRSSLVSPLTYFRFFGHVFGHASWDHFIGNMTLILLIGPLLEEKYGSAFILKVILTTALITGIAHFILFPNVMLMGASGVVYAFIILSSLTGHKNGTIPLTFILVAVIYIGGQIYEGIFVQNNISNLTHIIGGIVGGILGIWMV